jgi:hypothetical protein
VTGTLGMEPASHFEDFEFRVAERLAELGGQDAMVSMAFANPRSVVFADLAANYAYLDLRAGGCWDLYFAGYGDRWWGRFPAGNRRRHSADFFDPAAFHHMVDEFSARHEYAVRTATEPGTTASPWRYSGLCDLVSLMVYPGRRRPHFDWHSLRSVTLTDSHGQYVDSGLAEIVEAGTRWREEPVELATFGAGQPLPMVTVLSLAPALEAVASAVGAGVAGNAAYDLLKHLLG